MDIKFHVNRNNTQGALIKMKSFYQEILQQEIDIDFGNCIGFKNGISLWKLQEDYPIAKHLGKTYDQSGNKNLEICFETERLRKSRAETE
ncbi:MAG: hypothetical protein U5Q03_04695 [Bacteroidota bacterium]|nr:hypothetical protein [Bacteroidota bacterium]